MGGSEVWVVMVLVCVAGSGGVCGWCVWGGEDEGVFGHEHKARPGRSHTRSHQARQVSHLFTPGQAGLTPAHTRPGRSHTRSHQARQVSHQLTPGQAGLTPAHTRPGRPHTRSHLVFRCHWVMADSPHHLCPTQ